MTDALLMTITNPSPPEEPVTKTTDKTRWVVVCTAARGVFFGRLDDAQYSQGDDTITLQDPRMCVYWDAATRGVLGLGAGGPTAGCRITAAPPEIELRGVTAVITCSAEAVAAWQAAPWS